MFSTTVKRSVATLGVVAGLLAAAVPASAHGGGADFTRFVVDGPFTAKGEPGSTELGAANDVSALAVGVRENGSQGAVKAPTKADAVVVLIGANDYGLATAQGLIMKDGNICDPIRHIGC